MKRIIKNKKLNSSLKKGLAVLIPITTLCLMTSCEYTPQNKQYEYTRLEITSDGEYHEARQYEPFNLEEKEDKSKYISFSRWEQTKDGKYTRNVREFDIDNKNIEEIKTLIYSEQDLEEVLGKPTKSYVQMSTTLSRLEIERYEYDAATVYTKNEQKYVWIINEGKNVGILIAGSIAMVLGVGAAISWKKYDDMINSKNEKKLTLKKKDN